MPLNLPFFKFKLASLILAFAAGAVAPAASAEWLSLFSPKASALSQSEEMGLEAFNALGCGECHRDLMGGMDGSYAAGFRVVAQDALDDVAEKLGLPHSPAQAHQGDALELADRVYVRSADYNAVYVREVHADVPGVANSLRRFERASDSDRKAAVEYMLMF